MTGPKSQDNFFTKHLFSSGCTCPTKLYYKAHPEIYPEQQEHLPFIEHIRYNKRQLRRLLELLYPGGTRIGRNSYEGEASQTAELLEKDFGVLFRASFIHKSLFARLPLLEKDGDQVRTYYLQTKAFDPEHHTLTNRHGKVHSKWRDYVRDFAYLLYVIRQQYPAWQLKPYLVLPDKTATTNIDRLDQKLEAGREIDRNEASKLLAFVPAMKPIERFWNGNEPLFEEETGPLELSHLSFEESIDMLAGWYSEGEKVGSGVGKKCSSCEYRVNPEKLQLHQKSGFEECWQEVVENPNGEAHIFDLIGAGNGQLIKDEIYLQEEVPIDKNLSPAQIAESEGNISDLHRRVLQIAKAKGEDVPREIIRPQLFEELGRWSFPLYFLDFEAGSYAVPLHAGRKPYEMVVFQFSCHTLQKDGTLLHYQWLHPGDETYPNVQLVRELMKVPGLLEGTIIHYSGFERAALGRLQAEITKERETIPDSGELLSWLNKIIYKDSGRNAVPILVDLSRLVKHYHYNVEMADSLSIKDVLLATMKISPVLKERFSAPYNSSNFENQIWWKQKDEQLLNPYKMLSEGQDHSIGRGTEAMVAYARLRSGSLPPEELEELRTGLLRYCELDTLAMVMIYMHWEAIRKQ